MGNSKLIFLPYNLFSNLMNNIQEQPPLSKNKYFHSPLVNLVPKSHNQELVSLLYMPVCN